MPPASSRAPFIVLPLVARQFAFRCLRENRRVVQDESRRAELDSFHRVLTDISHGAATNEVRDFMIDAYVRGYQIATAEHVPFEGSTAVFTRRRYRDKWNRTVVRRISKTHNHTIKIKACVRPKGTKSGQWYTEDRIAYLRKKCRTQALWNLHLAGSLTGWQSIPCICLILNAGKILCVRAPPISLSLAPSPHAKETFMIRARRRLQLQPTCI